jgi:hypothetical protein
MAYQLNGLIAASDYNNIVGPTTPTSAPNTVNRVYGVGSGNYGYGQTPLTHISQNALINDTEWADLINTVSRIATHQGSTIASLTPPTTGDVVRFFSGLESNITTVTNNRLNARFQGSTVPTTTTASSGWIGGLQFTHTVQFENGDKARNFFNAGGQIALTFSSPLGSGINALFNTLASQCGTVVLSAPATGTATIVNTTYNGVTKIGGSGSPTISRNLGYYGLTTTATEIFNQRAGVGLTGYLSSFISVSARSNGTQGSNGDNGSTITLTTTWDQIPNGLVVSAGTSTTVAVRYPSASYLPTNTWGTVTVNGSVITL